MSKLLLSWIAFNNDFERNDSGGFKSVSENGPHVQFYQHFYQNRGYAKHILLYANPTQENYAEFLATELRRRFSETNVTPQLLQLNDVICLEEVKSRTESLLLGLSEHEVDIFFSPGTSIMQLSWYICHQTLGLNTHLLQTRAARFTKDNKPELTELTVELAETPRSAILKQFKVEQPKTDSSFKITPSIEPVYKRAYQVAQTDKVTVLIRGESGTGKEHLAKYIHEHSGRREGKFIPVNCSALSDNLLESRLFGHKKGMFTGADKDSTGIFEQADGGTVFLDEIGDISPQMQQTLLRVLQEREILPIGSEPKKVDVRVVAATNAPLEQMCKEGRFRWDLYYRLAVAELELPNLCDRGLAEVKLYLDHFIKVKRAEFDKQKELRFTKEALAAVLNYTFPGNVRELENMVESLYVFCDEEVNYNDLPKRLRLIDSDRSLLMKDAEKEHILKVYKLRNKNITHAATTLGIAKNTLKDKLRRYGVLKEENELEEA